jgi:S-adenosylmethionine:diacylglycerol 3-amino-3-carboxypropyl transferase
VYEDCSLEQRVFDGDGPVFCIASAGCTALALSGERQVVACDINPAQIEYVRRRLAHGARELGSAERILSFMRRLAPLAGWSHTKLSNFLTQETPEAQVAFWRAHLDTWRFRSGLSLLLSPLWLRGAYSSALLSSLPPRFDRVLRRRLERCFARHPNRTNPYAWALLTGSVPEDALKPVPVLPEARSRLELVVNDAAEYLEQCPPARFAGFSLSNILDGAPADYRRRLFSAVRRAALPGARVVIRSFAEPPQGVASNLAAEDRSMLWGLVDVRKVVDL